MGTSIFKDKKKFDKDNWVVTMFNAGAASSGHAALLIEGEDPSGELLLFRCEIFAAPFPAYLKRFMSSPGEAPDVSPKFDSLNAKHPDIIEAMSETVVCYVSLKEYPDYPKDFSHHTATSWIVTKPKVDKMLNNINHQQQQIEVNTRKTIHSIERKIMPNIEELFTLFKKYGQKSTLKSGHGINCVNWCEEQLGIAEVKVTSNVLDSFAARPEDHAAQRSCGPTC